MNAFAQRNKKSVPKLATKMSVELSSISSTQSPTLYRASRRHDAKSPIPSKHITFLIWQYWDTSKLQQRASLSSSSMIIVLPNTNFSWRATAMDLTMMIGLGSVERTGEQRRALLSSAGMRVSKMYSNSQSVQDSIIVAIPP